MRAKSVLPSHLGISCLLKRVEFLPSQVTKSLLHLLDEVETIADETPPIDNAKSRFGNPAFQAFYDKIVSVSAVLILVLTGLELIKHFVHARHPPEIRTTPSTYPWSTTERDPSVERVSDRVMGKSYEDRLWKWDGTQFSLLVVSNSKLSR